MWDFPSFPWLGFPPLSLLYEVIWSETWSLISSLYTGKHNFEMATAVIRTLFCTAVINSSLLIIIPLSLPSPKYCFLCIPKHLISLYFDDFVLLSAHTTPEKYFPPELHKAKTMQRLLTDCLYSRFSQPMGITVIILLFWCVSSLELTLPTT